MEVLLLLKQDIRLIPVDMDTSSILYIKIKAQIAFSKNRKGKDCGSGSCAGRQINEDQKEGQYNGIGYKESVDMGP